MSTTAAIVEVAATRSALQDTILEFLSGPNASAFGFWRATHRKGDVSIEQLCDVVYSLYLSDQLDQIESRAPFAFAELLARTTLPGWAGTPSENCLSVHNTAYAFGTLNLLRDAGHGDLFEAALAGRTFVPEQIVDVASGQPRFPKWLSHHNWRVSHWLGGIPSLLWSVGRSNAACAPAARELGDRVLINSDLLLDKRTGLIRLYKFKPFQKLFHLLYGLRHDPRLGDLGGVVHIHWVDYAEGRPYVAQQTVGENAVRQLLKHEPFMEKTPYCLDFDIVFIVRTALSPAKYGDAAIIRSSTLLRDTGAFIESKMSADYNLHRLPGALATMHECAMIIGDAEVEGLGPTRDVIKISGWL